VSAAGVILAAGESRRMGRPKALLPYQSTTFVENLITLFSVRCQPVIVVLGARAEEIRIAIEGARVSRAGQKPGGRPEGLPHKTSVGKRQFKDHISIVLNENYLSGQTSSFQAGLNAVPDCAEGVLFTLVDHPAVSSETIDALLAPPLPLIRIPRFAGERGHPIWFRRDLIPEFLAVPLDAPANQVTRAHRARTEFIDVDDFGVTADIDDPAAYARLLAGSGA
jgi:molybdenum cofactor cytidylyltransferase